MRRFLGLTALACCAVPAHAGDFTFRSDLLLATTHIEAATSDINVGPDRLPSQTRVYASLRPDLKWKSDRWLLLLSPRGEVSWTEYHDDPQAAVLPPGTPPPDPLPPPPEDPDQTDSDGSIHEAIVRYSPLKGLFLSVGRENLQWGPSYLVSASNPFIQDNGRNNPSREVPGLDYAKITWLMGGGWGLAAIANLDSGELDWEGDYLRQYALKLDYTGNRAYFSLIPSYRESPDDTDPGIETEDDYRVGTYAGWTVSEALLLYTEGSYRSVGDAYAALAGGAYTFRGGTNLALEYYHNSDGCTLEPYVECLQSGQVAPDPAQGGTMNALSGLTRRNYVLMQLLDHSRLERWDFTLRWIYGVDDSASQVVGVIDYDASNSVRLFLIGSGFFGGDDTEYQSVIDSYVSLGLRFSF